MSDYCTIEMLTVDHKKLTLKVRINRKNPLPVAANTAAQQIVQNQLQMGSLAGISLGQTPSDIIVRGQLGMQPDTKNISLPGIQGLTSGAGSSGSQTVTLAMGNAGNGVVGSLENKTLTLSTGSGKTTQVYALQPQTSPGGTTTYHLVPSSVNVTSGGGAPPSGIPNLDPVTIANITQQLQQAVAGTSGTGLNQPAPQPLYKMVKGQPKNPMHVVNPRSCRHDFPLDIPHNLIPEAESHVRLHDKGFQCAQCFKVRESKEDAITHVYKVHMCASLRRFQCSYCPKCYDNMKNLQTHVNACHAPTRMYACPTCPMKYKYPGDLKRHLSKNVCDRHKQGGFPCPKCGMLWYHQSALASHQRQCDGIQ